MLPLKLYFFRPFNKYLWNISLRIFIKPQKISAKRDVKVECQRHHYSARYNVENENVLVPSKIS